MYLPVHVLPRYLGVYCLIGGMAVLASFRLPPSRPRRICSLGLLALFVILLGMAVVPTTWREIDRAVNDLRRSGLRDLSGHRHLRIADLLRSEGLKEGDRIAHIGNSHHAYWARLARVKIVAEIPYRRLSPWTRGNTRQFQLLDEEDRARTLQALASPGVTAIVATNMPLQIGNDGDGRRVVDDWKQEWKTVVDRESGLLAGSPRREDGSLYLYLVDE